MALERAEAARGSKRTAAVGFEDSSSKLRDKGFWELWTVGSVHDLVSVRLQLSYTLGLGFESLRLAPPREEGGSSYSTPSLTGNGVGP